MKVGILIGGGHKHIRVKIPGVNRFTFCNMKVGIYIYILSERERERE
jgi:hypothetical protein